MRVFFQLLLCTTGCLILAASSLAQEIVDFPLSAGTGGALELALNVDGESTTFLIDTGAAMATINSVLFKRIKEYGSSRKVRDVAARMADGRVRKLSVYEVTGLHLGQGCELGPTEVIVVPGSGRNLLGLNVLEKFAPLTLSLTPPALGLSNCSAIPIPDSESSEMVVAAVSPL